MSNSEIGALVLTLAILVPTVHLFAYLFERAKQPRLIGEILAGIVLGPAVFGTVAPELSQRLFGVGSTRVVLDCFDWLGLMLLMFVSGTETRRLLAAENRRECAWLVGV